MLPEDLLHVPYQDPVTLSDNERRRGFLFKCIREINLPVFSGIMAAVSVSVNVTNARVHGHGLLQTLTARHGPYNTLTALLARLLPRLCPCVCQQVSLSSAESA